MPFSNLVDVKTTLINTTFENYTDTLAIAFNAKDVRSGSDTAYIVQSSLYGLLYPVKPSISTSTSITKSSLTIDTIPNKASGNSNTLLSLDNLTSKNAIAALDDSDTDSIFKILQLHNFSCSGRVYDGNIATMINLYNKSQIFWKRYRGLNRNKTNASQDFLSNNTAFISTPDTFGSNSGLTVPSGLSISGISCLFSEGGNLSINYKKVAISNGLEKELYVSFNYTTCEVIKG